MTKRLLIDASHAEETRVVVLDGNRLEDFDVETQSRRQLKGNIYLAKIVRVEPSLQAAFVEYGGNRHGFLAFSEIHPDYYQIPVADRQRLLALQEEEARAAQAEDDADEADDAARTTGRDSYRSADDADDRAAVSEAAPSLRGASLSAGSDPQEPDGTEDEEAGPADAATPSWPDDLTPALPDDTAPLDAGAPIETGNGAEMRNASAPGDRAPSETGPGAASEMGADVAPEMAEPADADAAPYDEAAWEAGPSSYPDLDAGLAGGAGETGSTEEEGAESLQAGQGTRVQRVPVQAAPPPELVGGEPESEGEDAQPPRPSQRFMRSYKIQEVIRRRQIILVQVVKEERGTKGAALTTYVSLAGRYCVLMPNSPRGGGISRKITSAADRRRLREVMQELDIPRGMGLIVRTAGAARPKPEIKRDGEYLLKLWDDIREQTMRSVAPMLIHEEASLIKRAIRDIYSRDVDDVVVDGEDGWRGARDYMRLLMPSHVKKVQLWPAGGAPLFSHAQVEAQLDAMLSPVVQLRSGGYLVLNQTEALVAIDVNSGRSTRERGIEETALRTNLEAAEEAARQLRLRDLAGLIVIDFIDMESKKHNAMVERRMAEALKHDRARIQMGHISHFGLLELSRQRLRPSVAETSLTICQHCGGLGHVRSPESAALHVLREIEEEGGRRRTAEIQVTVTGAAAMFILNTKRQRLMEIEQRYGMRICFAVDDSLQPAQAKIERLRAAIPAELPPPVTPVPLPLDAAEADAPDDEDDVDLPENASAREAAEPDEDGESDAADSAQGDGDENERRRRRRRRRRRGGRREDAASGDAAVMLDGGDQPDVPARAFPTLPPDLGEAAVPGHDQALEARVENTPAAEPVAAGSSDQAADGSETPAPGTEAGEDGARSRRGRRGGRRRRKPGEEAEPKPAAPTREAAPAFPAYVGPTPADPFAFAADIFDVMEQVELRGPSEERRPAPQGDEPTRPDTHQTNSGTHEPPAPETAHEAAHEAPPELAPVPAEPEVGPAIRPVVIGAEEAPQERKRGWWRR